MGQTYPRRGRLSKEEELRLVEEACGCSREAFDKLVSVFDKPLIGFIKGRIRDGEKDAEDIAQRVWGEVWKEIHKSVAEGGYDPEKAGFYTFVTNRFAKFKILQGVRGKGEQREVLLSSLEDEDREPIELPDSEESGNPLKRIIEIEEELRLKFVAFSVLFHYIFLCGGYPHQQLAFGFSRLIYGKKRKGLREIQGAPECVDSKHGDVPLKELVKTFLEYYTSSLSEDPDQHNQLSADLEPLRVRLPFTVEYLMKLDHESLSQHERLLEKKTESTCIRGYYTDRKGGFSAAIPDWCYKLERRIQDVLGVKKGTPTDKAVEEIAQRLHHGPIEPQGCNRCKLRHLPPCEAKGGYDYGSS